MSIRDLDCKYTEGFPTHFFLPSKNRKMTWLCQTNSLCISSGGVVMPLLSCPLKKAYLEGKGEKWYYQRDICTPNLLCLTKDCDSPQNSSRHAAKNECPRTRVVPRPRGGRAAGRSQRRERTYIPVLGWDRELHVPMRNVLLTVIKAGFLHEVTSDSGIGSITSYNEVTSDIDGNFVRSEK